MAFKFNPITGTLDLVGSGDAVASNNFSYISIENSEDVTVPLGQQMIVDGHVRVTGHLRVLGQLVNISQRQKEQFAYRKINAEEVVVVEYDRILFYKNHIMVNGHLRVLGELLEA